MACIAFVQVIRELGNQTSQFRVLALSATPGGDMKVSKPVIVSVCLIVKSCWSSSSSNSASNLQKHESRFWGEEFEVKNEELLLAI